MVRRRVAAIVLLWGIVVVVADTSGGLFLCERFVSFVCCFGGYYDSE